MQVLFFLIGVVVSLAGKPPRSSTPPAPRPTLH